MVFYLRCGLTTGPHLMNNKVETDANILKVQNSNPMLEFVANQPLQNTFLVYSHGLYLGFVVIIQAVESMLPIAKLTLIRAESSQIMESSTLLPI